MKRYFNIFRKHIITGFIFIMPVLITIAVIGKFWHKLLALGTKVSKMLHVDTIMGGGWDAIFAIILLILICTIAGFLVRLTIFKKLSGELDAKLASVIPGYNDLRKKTESKIGDEPKDAVFETCLVQTQEHWKPAYLIDVANNGDATVFIPSAPTFKTGQVAIVPAGSYKKLNIDSKTLNEYLSKLGKGISIT